MLPISYDENSRWHLSTDGNSNTVIMGMTETEIPSYDGNCKNMTETDKFLNQRDLNNFKIK